MFSTKTFLKSFTALFFPIVLQQVITLGVNLADNLMLGHYAENALAGVAAVNQIQFVYQNILMGLAEGVVLLGAQYFGEQNMAPAKKILAIALRIALGLSLLLFLVATFFPAGLMHIFTDHTEIVGEGVRYLRVIRFTYPFFACTLILLAGMRAVGRVKIAFYLSLMTLLVNAGINYVLIFGHFGAPRLGTSGAAIGTLCARILEVLVILFYLAKVDSDLQLRLPDVLRIDLSYMKDYLKVCAPVVLTQGLWGLNTALQTVILGHMTAAAIAANAAASNLYLLVKSAAIGAASAASVMIGQAIGRGNEEAVYDLSKKLQRSFLVVGFIGALCVFFLRIPVLSLYTLSPETKQMANTFLIILSVVMFFMSYQMPTLIGIIRGGGNPRLVAITDIISIWLIVLPISFLMAFVVKAPPAIVVCCLNADQVFKCVPSYIYANRQRWVKHLTR